MPTVKPRVNVTLPQDEYDLLRKFCSMSGLSMSGYLSQVVSMSIPQLRALVDVVEVARSLEGEALEAFDRELSVIQSDSLSSLSSLSSSLEESSPLTLNKGVRFNNKSPTRHKTNQNIFLAAGNDCLSPNFKGGRK